MSLVHKIDGVDVSSRVQFGDVRELTTCARGGERGGGKIIVTDSGGTLDLHGWHSYTVDETECIGRTRLFTGRIGGKDIGRGAEGPIGVGRVWDCDLEDLNALAHMKIFRVAAAKRAPETNLARIAWALSTAAVGGAFSDTGFVNDAHPRPFETADYRHNYPDELFDDISGVIGRDWFIFWDFAAAAAALFYNGRDAVSLDAMISISNVPGDADYDTVFPPGSSTAGEDAKIARAHDEVVDGVLMVWAHGEDYVTRAGTTATFFHDAPTGRDIVIENSRIGLQSTAILMAKSYLDAHSIERDTLTIPLHLPANRINWVNAGERVQVKLEHEPGYSTYQYIRVARKTVSEAGLGASNTRMYDVVLECTNAAPASASGSGAPGPGTFPHPPAGTPNIIQHKASNSGLLTPDATPTDGSLLFLWLVSRTDSFHVPPATPSGWTSVATAIDDNTSGYGSDFTAARLVTKVASSEPSSYTTSINGTIFVELVAGTTIDGLVASDVVNASTSVLNTGGAITPSAANALVLSFALVGEFFDVAVAPAAGVTEIEELNRGIPPVSPSVWSGYKIVYTPASTTITGTVTGIAGHLGSGGVTLSLLSSSSSTPPTPGRWVYNEVVTMTAGAGTTTFPFADGSLKVRYDIIDQTPAIVSYDGATGGFVMPSQPPLGTQVFVDYQGR